MPKGNTANQSFQRPDQSLTALFSRLTDDLTELFDAKLELLKTELKEEITSFASGASLIVGGAVVGVIGFAFLNVGIAFFVSMLFGSADLSPAVRYGLGFIITALLYLVIGQSLFWWQNVASQSSGLFRRGVRLNSSAISSGCRKKCSWLFFWDSRKRRKNYDRTNNIARRT